jgi:hypothetical protein
MSTSSDKDKKPTHPPEQKMGDTPVPPWEMPTPEEKAQARRAARLKRGDKRGGLSRKSG